MPKTYRRDDMISTEDIGVDYLCLDYFPWDIDEFLGHWSILWHKVKVKLRYSDTFHFSKLIQEYNIF